MNRTFLMEQEQICCGSVLPSLSANYPWFVAQNLDAEDQTEVQIFFTLHGPKSHYRCRIPELLGKHIRGCFHGWVLLSSHPDNIKWSLWNPITLKSIHLPPFNIHRGGDKIRYFCLSSPPDDPNSILLLTRFKRPNLVFCRLDRKRKKLRWTEMTYAKKLRSMTGFDGFLHCLTYCHGKVYAIATFNAMVDDTHRLIQVDILVKDREVVINLLPILEIPCPLSDDRFTMFPSLKGSSTELFTIVVGFKDATRKTIGAVYLYKLDMRSMMWNELEDLEDTVFSVELASDFTVVYSPAIASEFGGYIHIFCEKGKIIYSYHVRDKTIAVSSMPCLVQTSHLSAWAMLECRLEGDDAGFKKVEGKDDEIVVRSIKKGDEVEFNSTTDASDQLNTWSRFLEMIRRFCVGRKCLYLLGVSCFGNESRLEGDDADSIQEVQKEVGLTNESALLNIPFHVLETIMEFCVGVEFLNFRATCKQCHLAAPMIQWSSKTASERFQKYSLVSPWLMVFDRHQGIITFTDPMFGDSYFIKTPQELICDFQIQCSRDGWLLMLIQYGTKLVFFNPFTSDIRTLPTPVQYLESYCFSAPPTSPDCMVVGLTTDGERNIFIYFVAREPLAWDRFGLDFCGDDQFSFRFPTFYGRDLYALCQDGVVDVFKEIGAEDYSWEAVAEEAPTNVCRSLAQYFLVKCDQHLLLVVVSEFGESVEVFKPTDDLQWEKIDGLGRHTIFICSTTCLCVETKTPEMENKIYFPRTHSGNEKIVFYSLETCRYHTFNGMNIQEKFDDFFETKNHLSSHVWIEPRWS